jgi:lysophospholipase L1-like esterase
MAGAGRTATGKSMSRRTILRASLIGFAGTAIRAQPAAMKHVVVLGDSVFDNASYVGGYPDVQQQVADLLPQSSRVTLLARDGTLIAGVNSQLDSLPPTATHLVISAGGNDALQMSGILDERTVSVANAMEMLAVAADVFGRGYSAMLEITLKHPLPLAVCTIYEPRFPEPRRRRVASTALTVLNDRITREAFSRGLALIDLRVICDNDEDFTNAIEPSARGGAKIAAAIVKFLNGTPSSPVIGKS